VIIQIFTPARRSTEAKQEFLAAPARNLVDVDVNVDVDVDVAGSDLVIAFVENTPADWSFGFGRAQYTTGEVEKPGS
jgi:hypothetical protein